MNKHRGTWRTSLAVVMATAGAVALPAADTQAVTAKLQDDFNGDGYSDLAVAAPEATVGGETKAGYVAVLYGSASGLTTTSKQVFSQNTAGIPDTVETDDLFGSALTTADMDGDGYADLVVGASGEDSVPGGVNSGAVQVIWGGAKGLSGGSLLATGTSSVGAYGALGSDGGMTVADVDRDGAADLVAVENYTKLRVVKGPFARDGSSSGGEQVLPDDSDPRYLDLASGDVNGDGYADVVGTAHDGDEYDARRVVYWPGGAAGLGERQVVLGSNGYALEGGEWLDLGDVNNDGYEEIVVGRLDGYDSDLDEPLAKGGRVTVIPGSANGPVGTKPKYINQDTTGVPGVAERGDTFGADVSVADVNGDGYDDVSAGVPGEDFDGKTDTGSVIVLSGSATGLTGTGAKGYSQDTTGVPGTAETFDGFGAATRLVDANRDGRAELAVGAPGENAKAGSVWVFRSTSSGITPTGSFTFGAGTLGTVAANAKLGSGFNY